MENLKINICCEDGHPTDPKTWSGTPCNLHKELCRIERCADAFQASSPKWLKLLLSGLSVLIYGKNYPSRLPFRRYANSWIAARKTNLSSSRHTLHTGSFSLPFLKRPSDQFHYLYIDSTWNLWHNHMTHTVSLPKHTQHEFKRLETVSYKQADHIFSISEYVSKDLIDHYGIPEEKISVVGTGLGVIKPFRGQKDLSSKRILFAAKGRFRDKGGHLVIDAFRLALKTDTEIRLTILGGDSEARQYENEPNIEVLGFLSIEELQAVFDSHVLFLMPAYNEPWGLVYLEAMACKMPIIGLNKNSFPEISGYGKYGFTIYDEDAKSVAETILLAFRNPQGLKEMGEAAQEYCMATFSWEKTIDRVVRKIDSIQLEI